MNRFSNIRSFKPVATFAVLAAVLSLSSSGLHSAAATHITYDISTLKGKIASLRGTAGLQIRFSAFIEAEAEAEEEAADAPAAAPIVPVIVLNSPLDATSVGPSVTVNRDTAAAPQNEPAIAVDPNNSNRVVSAAND